MKPKGNKFGEFRIGSEATYIGDSPAVSGPGSRVLVTGIFRYDEDENSDDRFVNDNKQLAELGGVRSCDGAEVHAWLEKEGRWSFVGQEIEDISTLQISSVLEIRKKKIPKRKG